MRDAIEDAAHSVLDIFGENTEEVIDEAAEATWTGEDDWADAIGSPEERAHNERTFAAVVRALIPLLEHAATEADKRAAPQPVPEDAP